MRATLKLSLFVLVAVAAYLGSYCALVQRGWGDGNLGVVSWYPVYRFSGPWPCGAVGTLYEPAHVLDRRFLRTTMWEERQDLLALLAAELSLPGIATATNSVAPNQHLEATPR